MSKFEPALSLKIFSGTTENTQKNIESLIFPVFGSIKWDGWRMFDLDGVATCRSLKPPRNYSLQKDMAELYAACRDHGCHGLDGEIMAGDRMSHNVMQATTSFCNSYENTAEKTYMVFDLFDKPELPAEDRHFRLLELVEKLEREFPWVHYTPQHPVYSYEEALIMMQQVVEEGGEGMMGKQVYAPYNFKRATTKNPVLWALKPYADAEAEILGYEEEMQNNNVQEKDERGNSKRSGHKANLVGKNTMGKAICRHPDFAETFSVGAGVGLTAALRKEIWEDRDNLTTASCGVKLKFKYLEIGVIDRPRQPKWGGLRYPEDMAS